MSFTAEDVKEGDIIMMMYDEFSAKLIAALDDGIYSHSTYFTGEYVVGCVRKGLVHQTMSELLAEKGITYADVYRFYGNGGDPKAEMGSSGWPAAPVTAVCEAYMKKGVSYAYDDLYFYWILIILHNIPKTDEGRKKMWFVINAIFFLMDKADPKLHKGMICSEFITRIFLENPEFPKYAIKFADTYQIPGPPDQEFEEAYKAAMEALKVIDPELEKKLEDARQGSVSALAPELVTPNNLRHSPSLKFQGRIIGTGSPENG
ncbi:MAG: hypothetical protein GJ676_18425 [Rhodobacteraceae bacterium]|nr:hypothetical protein [Paracoccaceae bacterium]